MTDNSASLKASSMVGFRELVTLDEIGLSTYLKESRAANRTRRSSGSESGLRSPGHASALVSIPDISERILLLGGNHNP